jgi:hypothetical protein
LLPAPVVPVVNPGPQVLAPVGGPFPLVGLGPVPPPANVAGLPVVMPMPLNPPNLGMVAAAPVFNPVPMPHAVVPPPIAASVNADGGGTGATDGTPSRWSVFFNMVTPRRG